MTRSKDTSISELLDYVDTETFLDYEGVKFRKTYGSSGTQLNIRECPRCGGNAWKVYLNAENGLGNCFHGSCVGEPGFNIFSFAKALWGETSRETIERLKRYSEEQGWVPKRTTSREVDMSNEEVELPPSYKLPYKDRNLKYLTERGISAQIAEYFNLQYCVKGAYIYYDGEGVRRWQNYDSRVIIPIFNLDSELVTFQGRDITGIKEKKYLFPPGLSGTARFLYNGNNVIGCEDLVVGEGAFDVMAMKIAMDEDVAMRNVGQIGTFGKNLSHGSAKGEDQLGAFVTLRKFGLKRVVMMWDGESSAIKAAVDACKLLKSIGLECRIALLPQDKDPNEVPASVVRECYNKAVTHTSPKLIREIIMRGRANSSAPK